MDYLWTPWRYTYITKSGDTGNCVFCAAAQPDSNNRETLVVHRAVHNFLILNRFPSTNGHLMIVPYAHLAVLEDLSDAALAEMMLLARDSERRLRALYRPEGLNLGMNIGQAAGAGIAGHVH